MPPIDWSLTGTWYDDNAADFEAATLDLAPPGRIVDFAASLPAGGRVLDAGCGAGRDLRWLAAAGFAVEGLDLSPAMVEAARRNTGYRIPVRRMDFAAYADPEGSWDGIWAMASLLHLPKRALGPILERLHASLAPGGILAFSLKTGQDEALDDRGRPMSRYAPDELNGLVLAHLGDRARAKISTSSAGDSSRRATSWLEATITRTSRTD